MECAGVSCWGPPRAVFTQASELQLYCGRSQIRGSGWGTIEVSEVGLQKVHEQCGRARGLEGGLWRGGDGGGDFHACSHVHMLPSCYVNMCVFWLTLEKPWAL